MNEAIKTNPVKNESGISLFSLGQHQEDQDKHIDILRSDIRDFKAEVRNEFKEVRQDINTFKIEVRNEFKEVRNEINTFKIEVKSDFKSLNKLLYTGLILIISGLVIQAIKLF